jgi:hypothetical protein
MLASTRYKRWWETNPTSFPLSKPHKIFSPQPLLPFYIMLKKRIYSFFEVKIRKCRNKNKEVRCTTTINNFGRNSKRWNAQQQPKTSKAQRDELSATTNNLKQPTSSKKWGAQQQQTMLRARKGEVHNKE